MFEVTLPQLPAGYVAQVHPDTNKGWIVTKEFTSTEDGQEFLHRLEGIPESIRQQLPEEVLPSQIDHMLAIIHRDSKASVYINELAVNARIRITRPIQAGEAVMVNDIAGLDRLDLGVDVPNDAGVVFVFSIQWRKGLFFDLTPLGGASPTKRTYDLDAYLGRIYRYLLFQERFSLSDEDWDTLLKEKWFPFIGLRDSTIKDLILGIQNQGNPDSHVDAIGKEVRELSQRMLSNWGNHAVFAPHIEILERAVEHFKKEDWLSCTGLLVPRIEGILRSYHKSLGETSKFSAKNLVYRTTREKSRDEQYALMFPKKFADYLDRVYFVEFDDASTEIDISRHSVGHGVASPSSFDKKAAVVNLLMVNQLFFLL